MNTCKRLLSVLIAAKPDIKRIVADRKKVGHRSVAERQTERKRKRYIQKKIERDREIKKILKNGKAKSKKVNIKIKYYSFPTV